MRLNIIFQILIQLLINTNFQKKFQISFEYITTIHTVPQKLLCLYSAANTPHCYSLLSASSWGPVCFFPLHCQLALPFGSHWILYTTWCDNSFQFYWFSGNHTLNFFFLSSSCHMAGYHMAVTWLQAYKMLTSCFTFADRKVDRYAFHNLTLKPV